MTQDQKPRCHAAGDIAAAIAVFDLDGTLVETDAANGAAYRRAMEEIGLRNMVGFAGRVTGEAVRVAARFGAEEMSAVVRAKVEAYCHELWRTRLGPAAEALKFVLVNRAAFAKVVLLTDSSERRAWETLTHWDLARHFDEIVCNGGRGDKYANYFGSSDSDPAACVVWENEEGKVRSAIAAGVKVENTRKVG